VLIAAIAWGAFAFGAVYPWAYWPLVVAVVAVGLAGLLLPGSVEWSRLKLSGLAVALAAFLLACGIQLVPLPWSTVGAISPDAQSIVSELDIRTRQGLTTVHPLSIAPAQSLTGLVVLASLALLVIGGARLFSIAGVAAVAGAIAVIGAVLALIGIIQQPLYEGKIYGFWAPLQAGARPFGPFVNRNHFAGWMLMGLPLTLGLVGSYISRDSRRVRPALRDRILWFSTPHATTVTLLLGAIGIMALSLIKTTSRSGMTSAAVAVVIVLLFFRRRLSRGRRLAAVSTVTALMALVVAWAGTSAIASRFATGNMQSLNGRIGVWEDTTRIIRLYSLAGTGLNTYSVAMTFYQEAEPSQRYLQAHNDYLQLAADGGLLLTIPAAMGIAVLVWAVRRRFAEETSRNAYWIRTGAAIGLVAIGLQETVEFSLQMPGNAVLFAVLCSIALHKTRTAEQDGARRAVLGSSATPRGSTRFTPEQR
jgi:O-antigen ligase